MALPPRQHGLLSLELICYNGHTAIARQRSAPPLQICGLQPLPDGGAYLQIVNPAGGLLEGDSARIAVTLRQGSHLYLTTQAATKVYPAEQGAITRQSMQVRVAPHAILEYFPLPLIPFARAIYAQEISIQVDPGGICMVADVLAPGRAARGELFAYRMVRSRVEGWVGDQLVLFDQMRLEPHQHRYKGLALLEGRTHLATLYVLTTHPLGPWIAGWNRQLARQYGGGIGITELAHGGLIVRVLGQSSQEVLRGLDDVHRRIREEGLGLPPLRVYRPFA